MSYNTIGTIDGIYSDNYINLELSDISSIEVDDACVETSTGRRLTCQHVCTFQLRDNTKHQNYQTADQILILKKLAKDRLELSSDQKRHLKDKSLGSKHFCVIQ